MTTDNSDRARLKNDRGAKRGRYKRRRTLWWLGLVVVLVIGAGWWLRPRTVAVQTTPIVIAYPSQQFVVLNSTGHVVAQRKAAISSKVSGRLEWLGVVAGTRVKAGDVIARLDARDVQAQLEAANANIRVAQAAVEQAEAENRAAASLFKRTQDLIAQKRVSASALDQAKTRADRAFAGLASAEAGLIAAEANARTARVAVDYASIRAPFDGVILSKNANVGDLVTPFSSAADSKGAVVSMADVSALEVEADVSESGLSKIHVGQPCEITLDALPDARFRGTISRIVPTVDRAKATVMTKVRFDEIDPRVLPEMSSKVSFLSQPITAEQQMPLPAINAGAFAQRDGKTVIYVVRESKAIEVAVTPGPKVGDVTAIVGEAKTGERAVLNPTRDLNSGTAVTVPAQ